MSVKVEKLEHNMAKLTITVESSIFDSAIQKAYEKQKGDISVQGFRKGKVPRAVIEKMYGVSIFYEEAVNIVIPEEYSKAVDECEDLLIVSRPEINVIQVEKGKDFIFEAKVALKPDVTLGKYKGLKVKKNKIEVTDEEIDEKVKIEQNKNARIIKVVDRDVEEGDDILLDFEGFVDGKSFEGGKAEKFPLNVGSKAFIPGFEEQIIGKKIDEDFDVNVTFPEDYSAKNLAGKDAVFKCKVREINAKELPELNDEFASEVSEFDTLKDWKKEIKDNIIKSKEEALNRKKEDDLIKEIVETSKMDIPDSMIELQVDQMVNEFTNTISSQGMSIEQYVKYTGITFDKIREEMRPRALERIKSSLVLAEIANSEGIEVSNDDIEEELKRMASLYKMELEKIKELIPEEERSQMKQDLKIKKALNFIVDNAIEE